MSTTLGPVDSGSIEFDRRKTFSCSVTLGADNGSGVDSRRRTSAGPHSSSSAFVSGDRSFHRGGGVESCCRSDRSFRVSGTERGLVRIFGAGGFRRQAANAYKASAQDDTNCKIPIISITPGNDISVISAAPRVSYDRNPNISDLALFYSQTLGWNELFLDN